MAKKVRGTTRQRKITLIQTDKSHREVTAMMGRKKPVKINLFVRTPESAKATALTPTARLCSCRRICVALV